MYILLYSIHYILDNHLFDVLQMTFCDVFSLMSLAHQSRVDPLGFGEPLEELLWFSMIVLIFDAFTDVVILVSFNSPLKFFVKFLLEIFLFFGFTISFILYSSISSVCFDIHNWFICFLVLTIFFTFILNNFFDFIPQFSRSLSMRFKTSKQFLKMVGICQDNILDTWCLSSFSIAWLTVYISAICYHFHSQPLATVRFYN